MRILVADDDEDLRATLRFILERAGYEVEAVADGEQAVRAHKERPVDVLITDLFMPERDGLETVQLFRARYPDVRIIAISGGGYTGQRADHLAVARHAGAHASLRKPFEVSALLERIRSLTAPKRP